MGYSPWDHKESNTTEQLTLSLFLMVILYLSFEITVKLFMQQLHHFTFPPAIYEVSISPHPHQHLYTCNFFLFLPFFFFSGHSMRHGDLPQPGIKPMPPAVEAWSLNHWTTREVPTLVNFCVFGNIHTNGCEVMPHCGFEFHFLND